MQQCNRSVGVEQAGSKPASIHAQASRVLPHKTNPKPIQFQTGCAHSPLSALPRGLSVSQEDAGPLLTSSMAPIGMMSWLPP